MWHYLTGSSNSIVLAKGGSKLETTTAQLARKSSVWPRKPENFPYLYIRNLSNLKEYRAIITSVHHPATTIFKFAIKET